LAQIEPRRQFAVAGIVFVIIARRDVRGSDLQHVGAVLGQGARAGRAGSGRVRGCPIVAGRRPAVLRPGLADLQDLHQRQFGNRRSLRMLRPFGHAAHHAARTAGRDNRLFERELIPFCDGLSHRLAVFCQTSQDQIDELGLVACAGLVEPVTEVRPCLVNEMPSRWSAACSSSAFDTSRFRPAPAAVSLKSWWRLLPRPPWQHHRPSLQCRRLVGIELT